MSASHWDLCIIGGGSGGLSVAAGAAQMGARVVLIEGHKMGGDCLNAGCVPSKALIAAAGAAQALRGRPDLGAIPSAALPADYAAAQAHVAGVIAAIAPHDSVERFESLGVTVLRDWARFTSARTVEVDGRTLSARRFVIATGSRAVLPPIPGLSDVPALTNETLWSLTECPGHLLILGAGPIGLEMAQAHRRLGAQVTVIEAAKALAREDPEMTAPLLAALRAEGIEILEDSPALRVHGTAGAITVEIAGRALIGTHLLVATGRRPNLERLDLPAARIAHDARGVKVDQGLRSVTNRRVFAIGDAAGGGFTHVAGYHAGLVVRAALLGLPVRVRGDHIPRVTYTSPELAHVGPSLPEARRRHGAALQVIDMPLSGNDRAQASGQTGGRLRLMVAAGRPVGATLLAPGAGELIAFWCQAITLRTKLSALSGVVLPYPTVSEIHKRAIGAYFAPRLFDSPLIKRTVRLVQRLLP